MNQELTRRINALLDDSWCVTFKCWNFRHDGAEQELVEEWSIWCSADERRWTAATLEQAVNLLENDKREEAMR